MNEYVMQVIQDAMKSMFLFVDDNKNIEIKFSTLNSALLFLESYYRVSNSDVHDYYLITSEYSSIGAFDNRYIKNGFIYHERNSVYRIDTSTGKAFVYDYWYDKPVKTY